MWIRDVIVNSSVNSFVQDPMLRKVIQSDVVKLCLFVWWLYFTYLHILWLIYRTWEWHSFTIYSTFLSSFLHNLVVTLFYSTYTPALLLYLTSPCITRPTCTRPRRRCPGWSWPWQAWRWPGRTRGRWAPSSCARPPASLSPSASCDQWSWSTILSGKRISSADIRYIHTSSLLDLLA